MTASSDLLISPRPLPPSPGSAAGRLVAELGPRAELRDLYDEGGCDYYHGITHKDGEEIRELLDIVTKRDGPVLELGAGAGRQALPLVAAGQHVTGLDLSHSMLDLLRSRVSSMPRRMQERLTIVQGDMTNFDVGHTFPTVFLGSTTVTLLDQEQRAGMFASVKRHLNDDGLFYVSVRRFHDVTAPREIDFVFPDHVTGNPLEFHEYYDGGGTHREVTILPAERSTGTVVIGVSRPRVLPDTQFLQEASDAGFVPVDERLLGSVLGEETGQEVLIGLAVKS